MCTDKLGEWAEAGLIAPVAEISEPKVGDSIDKAELESALKELVDLGWLDLAQQVGDIDLYRLSDRARQNELFWHNVNKMAKNGEFR
jgi:hypothetical protein